MKTRIYIPAGLLIVGAVLVMRPTASYSHCQIPCGIYDDAARVEQMREDATTIEKSITSFRGLLAGMEGNNDPTTINQIVRWTTNKETHATRIITTVSEYFLTQKVAEVAPGATGYDEYLKKLGAHHAVMRAAMKCKQDASPATVTALRTAIDGLAAYYDTSGHEHN